MNLHSQLCKRIPGAAVLILGFALANAAGAAGLSQVKQTVFGMDCAPCAHGIKKGLSKIDGITEATVSLNEGYALVKLEPDSAVTMEQIRQVIRENGFTPKDAEVAVTGRLMRVDDKLILASGAGEQFSLVASPGARAGWQELLALSDGDSVTVDGVVGSADSSQLAVLAARPASHEASAAPRLADDRMP